ncbi:hypothetical protein GCM10027612_69600 [Microbispora bryophytorum subsp. camponoti]
MPHPQLRVTNQDREQVVEHVKAAYAEGRLDKYEMDERLHLAMTARTHADLVPIMNDLYGTRPAYVPRPPAYRPAAVPDGETGSGPRPRTCSACWGCSSSARC